MSDGRSRGLDVHKSNGESFRSLPAIVDEANKASEMLKEKTKEDMTSQELVNFGMTFNEKSDYKMAQEFFNAALEKVETETLSQDEKNVIQAYCHYGLANCERELGRPAEAIEIFKKAQTHIENRKELYDLRYLIARNIGIAYLAIEDYVNAESQFSQALHVAVETQQVGRIPAVLSYQGLSVVLSGKATDKGFELLEKARLLYPKHLREESLDWAAHRYHMGRAYEAKKNPVDTLHALVEYKEAHRLRMQLININKIGIVYFHSRLGDTNAGLGRVYASLGHKDEARKYFSAALDSYEALGATKKAETIRQALLSCFNLVSFSLTSRTASRGKPDELNDQQALIRTPGYGVSEK